MPVVCSTRLCFTALSCPMHFIHGLHHWVEYILLYIILFSTISGEEYKERLCTPSNSPNLPNRVHETDLVRAAFSGFVNATQVVNARRLEQARARLRGKPDREIFKILMGIQVDSLGPYSLGGILPAIDVALEDAQNQSVFDGITFATEPILALDSLTCDALAFLYKIDQEKVHVVFGPLSDFTLAINARHSSAVFNIPIITPGGYAQQLADKFEYSMLTRVFFSYADLPWIFGTALKEFDWLPHKQTPLAVFTYRDTRQKSRSGGPTSLVSVFQHQSIQKLIEDSSYKAMSETYEDLEVGTESFLKKLPEMARVVILCADPDSVRHVLLKAQEMGLTNGEYAFFNIDIFTNRPETHQPWFRNTSDKAENDKAREAYRSLMTFVAKLPDVREFTAFVDHVDQRAERDYDHSINEADIRTYGSLFHDAVKLYLLALEEAIPKRVPVTDGKAITKLMRNRTFQGKSGTVRIDSNGDRNADYSLLDMNPNDGYFRSVADFYGNERKIHFLSGVTIDWVNAENRPPRHTPKCGFDGSKCRNNYVLQGSMIGTFGLLALVAIAFIAGYFLYKATKFQAELRALEWLIPSSQLEFSKQPVDLLLQQLHGNKDRTHPTVGAETPNDQLMITSGGDSYSEGAWPNTAGEEAPNQQTKPHRSRRKLSLKPILLNTPTSALVSRTGDSAAVEKRRIGLPPVTFVDQVDRRHDNNESQQHPQQHTPLLSDPGNNTIVNGRSPSRDEWTSPTVQAANAVQRIHQRLSRLSRSAVNSEDLPATPQTPGSMHSGVGTTATVEFVMQRVNTRSQPSNLLYMKNPSFDYSTVTGQRSRISHVVARRRADGTDVEQNHFPDPVGVSRKKKESQVSVFSQDQAMEDLLNDGVKAHYKGGPVYLKPLRKQIRYDNNKEITIEVKRVKDLNHDNICRFVGVCHESPHQCIVYEYCPRGSILDFLHNEQFTMDWMFKLSLIQDIWRGLTYLHPIFGPHGNMKSSNCLLDSRFAVKLTDFGIPHIRGNRRRKYGPGSAEYFQSLLWTAPELIPQEDAYPTDSVIAGTVKGDVYSFAIICQELVYRKGTFYIDDDSEKQPSPKTIIDSLRQHDQPGLRPKLEVHDECHEDLVQMIRQAWSDDPNARPDFRTIGKVILTTDTTLNLVDNLMERMNHYTDNLEAIVVERTQQYQEEKKKAEDLLYSMLPQAVAAQLIKNKVVEAESFEKVTIYFSDIVGFTALSAESTPMQIVEMLNQLYTLFDRIIVKFDAYKVETIGDAYMVASGLPTRNGNLHAREVARMSIAFLKAIFEFQIPHCIGKRLELRIGVHSGPVCAGVVGMKMPRYCLFGDTVNTSSRMESNGLPMKIHISQDTFEILKGFNTFVMTERGLISMKGKGNMKTYWLHGEGNYIVDSVPPGAMLLGGQMDGSFGPIAAGAIRDQRSLPPSSASNYHMISRPHLPEPAVKHLDRGDPLQGHFEGQLSSELAENPSQMSNNRRCSTAAGGDNQEAAECQGGFLGHGKRRVAVCHFDGSTVPQHLTNPTPVSGDEQQNSSTTV